MSNHLKEAARRRHEDAEQRANEALATMSRRSEPINFVAVARKASVSTDFLYRHDDLRRRISELRGSSTNGRASSSEPLRTAEGTTSAVRNLVRQLKELRRRHHEETSELRARRSPQRTARTSNCGGASQEQPSERCTRPLTGSHLAAAHRRTAAICSTLTVQGCAAHPD